MQFNKLRDGPGLTTMPYSLTDKARKFPAVSQGYGGQLELTNKTGQAPQIIDDSI